MLMAMGYEKLSIVMIQAKSQRRKSIFCNAEKVEEKTIEAWNNTQFKGTCKLCVKYGHKVTSDARITTTPQINSIQSPL